MIWVMMLVVTFVQAPQPDPNVALELGKFKGIWRVVSMSQDGHARDEAFKNVRFRFNDNVMTMTDGNDTALKRPDGKVEEQKFVLDLAASPRALDVTVSKKYKSLGIYVLTGDELKLCLAEPGATRPAEFKGKAGVTLVVLKRASK